MRIYGRQGGFALVELMVVASLLAVVLGALLAFLDSSGKLAPTYQERGLVIREAQVGLERMTRELRQASSLQLGPQWVEFDMAVRGDQTQDDGDGEDEEDVGDGTDEAEGLLGGAAQTLRVRYDCSYGPDGLPRTEPPYQCWRFAGDALQPPCDTGLTPAGVVASGVRNAAVFSLPDGSPSYVEVRLELQSKDFSEPADSPEPPVVVLRDGVEPRNLGRTPPC